MLYQVAAYINKIYDIEADSVSDAIELANEIVAEREDMNFFVVGGDEP